MNDTVYFSPFIFGAIWILAYCGAVFIKLIDKKITLFFRAKKLQKKKKKEKKIFFENDLSRYKATKVFLAYFDCFAADFAPEMAFFMAVEITEQLRKDNKIDEKFKILREHGYLKKVRV